MFTRSIVKDFIRSFQFKNYFVQIIFACSVLVIFLINTVHESYPDEFDNILGGWYILHGRLPYIGFFTHHGPFAYFLAAFTLFFSGRSFVHFRIVYAVLLFIFTFLVYRYLKKSIGNTNLVFYPFFIILYGIQATYFWSHMLLADNLAGLFFTPLYILIVLKTLYKKKFTIHDLILFSLFSSLGLYSSLTYIYLFLLINVVGFFLYCKHNKLTIVDLKSKIIFYPVFILLFPHIVFLIYLLITGSFLDYVYQNFVFNTKYYIYNYPQHTGLINPVRYAIIIAHEFLSNFWGLVLQARDFNFSYPVNITLALANVSLFLFLILKKKYTLAFFIFLFLIYGNVRSNPLSSGQRDYQIAVYSLISFFNGCFVFVELLKAINTEQKTGNKIIFSFLFIFFSVYSFFSLFFLTNNFLDKAYFKYMGKAPLIYDRPWIAPIMNDLVDKNDFVWVGPFEFEELFYTNGMIPSRYHILIPGIGKSEKIQNEMLSDFAKNKPKVIMFDQNFYILGNKVGDYSRFFLRFLSENYITLPQYKSKNIVYRSVAPVHSGTKVDLESKLYIRKDAVEDVTERLFKANYIKTASQ